MLHQGGSSRGGRIGPSVATQSGKCDGSQNSPLLTFFLFTYL